MGAIFRREFKSYFTSPIGYIFLAAFYAYAGFMFANTSLQEGYAKLDSVFYNMYVIILILIPILTMRTMSEDKRAKTDQCLLTAPVSLMSVVAGKFIAAYLVYIIGTAIFGVLALVVSAFGQPDWNVILGNIVGLILLGGAYIAIGIFCSSFTENQIVAAVISFVVLLVTSFFSTIGGFFNVKIISTVFDKLAFDQRYYSFTSGVFDFSNVIFFISVMVVFVFLTVRVLEKRRWS